MGLFLIKASTSAIAWRLEKPESNNRLANMLQRSSFPEPTGKIFKFVGSSGSVSLLSLTEEYQEIFGDDYDMKWDLDTWNMLIKVFDKDKYLLLKMALPPEHFEFIS